MGPLFFRAENKSIKDAWREYPVASMGPLFFRAENVTITNATADRAVASMGPLFFRAENVPLVPGSCSDSELLQWGRSFSERRTRRHAGPDREGVASMGPLFFRAENREQEELLPLLPLCFNGAALFQSGEPRAQCGSGSPGCFNGAALFQSGERLSRVPYV